MAIWPLQEDRNRVKEMHEENVLLDIIYPVVIGEMPTFWVALFGIWNTSVNERSLPSCSREMVITMVSCFIK